MSLSLTTTSTSSANSMNYICLVNGLLVYIGTDPKRFEEWKLEEWKITNYYGCNAKIEYLALTDAEYDERWPNDDAYEAI